MKLRTQPSGLLASFERLSMTSTPLRPSHVLRATLSLHPKPITSAPLSSILSCRPFSTTSALSGNWLLPTQPEKKRSRKGRPRVPTGGSSRGTTVEWGDYGLRMCDHHRRVSAAQLKNGEEAIKTRLRGMRYRLYKRVSASIGVYKSGNETRMGKGKGSFDHWASRIAVSKIIFELKGDIHEQIVKDAFRLAGNKMPGMYEFVRKGDPAVVGITKLENGITMEDLKRPRRVIVPAPLPAGSVLPQTVSPDALPTPTSASMSPDA